jgi:hypothetical protein
MCNFFFTSTLRKGKHKLYVWPDCEADGNHDSKTPSKIKNNDDNEMNKLEKVYKISSLFLKHITYLIPLLRLACQTL